MSFKDILYAVADGIATVTINRPEQLNACTPETLAELTRVFDLIDADDAVRAVVVTGEGRAYSVGADLSFGTDTFSRYSETAEDGSLDYGRESSRDLGGLLTLRIYRCLKPVIGAINGIAAGIGATMTLPMDVRLASESARFGFVFTRRGIVPEGASSFFLPRIVGISRAMEWCCSGRVFGADEALAAGLVRAVHPAAELLPAAYAMARSMTEASAPVSVAVTRQLLWRGLGMTHPMEAHRMDSRAILSRGRSGDVAEGVRSFTEKRAPSFPDRVSQDLPAGFPWWDEPNYF